ncbi:glycosyltransferase family 2 protein [Olsenella sp. An290]|uniref:glycosyltransferase family 2 protein n=1 Tax=Olsenella sp. An290 TaxID=1965625 RepID=UPI000B3725D6|nr:glycosyltransferase family 2 protein [Olsenella sp. An290]OUO34603.1 hypothetical protein B5F84_06240 [Olsenella sp. An290]
MPATSASDSKKLVSVVIPCYYSEKTIEKVVSMTREVLVSLGYRYEFVLVNDGSTDGTFERIRSLCMSDPAVTGINFAKNFGQHSAIIAGLRHVHGDYVMLMDDDMQTHPSQCKLLLDEMEKDEHDVVFAKYPQHKEALWRRVGSEFTLWTMRVLTGRPKGIEASNFLVMKRFVCDEMVKYDGPYVYIQGLMFRATHNMVNVTVKHFDREVGTSGYTLRSLVRLWSTVLNFSMVPLRFASVAGAALGLLGLIWAVVLVVQKLLDPSIQTGWSSLMVTVILCSGIIVMFLGLIGEYLGRLTMTVSKTPQYVLKEVVEDEGACRER